VARLNSNGTLDAAYDTGLGANGSIFAIGAQPDGKAIIGGRFSMVDGIARGNVDRLNGDHGVVQFVSATASVLERLDAAGAVQIGTLNMTEFAYGPTGQNAFLGDARNPWNPDYITGGSSSGSAVSVAARVVYGALGSDTAGSVRLPAAMCGLVGMKTTFGLVSRAGAMPLSQSLDTVGPLTRTVADNAMLLSVLAGHDPRGHREAHLAWGAKLSAITTARKAPASHSGRAGGGKIRIGYVSADFREHAVTRFLLPVLEWHDRSSFEVFCYANQGESEST